MCDLLLHAGDITMMGDPAALREFNEWCSSLLDEGVVRKIVSIAGNHDFFFERNPEEAKFLLTASTYLQDSGVELDGRYFWGTPWQPWFFDWAFNLRSENELREKFEQIPARTDVLLCHGPPRGILDRTRKGDSVGSTALLERILKVGVKLVVFGHIHESYGQIEQDGITFVNASICDVRYQAVNKPIVMNLD